jgi:hypothetical protein
MYFNLKCKKFRVTPNWFLDKFNINYDLVFKCIEYDIISKSQ